MRASLAAERSVALLPMAVDFLSSRRMLRLSWLVFAILFGTIAMRPVAAATIRCSEGPNSYFSDWMVVRAPRAYFYSAPTETTPTSTKLSSFLITGDFVFMRKVGPFNSPATPMDADYACVRYNRSGRPPYYGWIRKTDLIALDVDNEVEGPEPPAALKSLLGAMPPAGAWFRAGKTPQPFYWEHGFIGNFLCIPSFEPERKRMCVLTTTRSVDGRPECGTIGAGNRYATFDAEGWYIAYLFNNGIAVVSQTGEWGNHGQSDPGGFYVPSDAATRACPNHIAP